MTVQVHLIEQASDDDIATWIAARLRPARDGAPVAIAIPGGSTPFPILARLAGSGALAGVSVWPGDDRDVPEEHPASNLGRIRATLAGSGAVIAPLEESSRPPRFRLAWLGMGEDGHIASLFPGSDPRADDPLAVRRLTPDPLPPEAPFPRITMTMPTLLDSDELLFVIRGAAKRAILESAMRGESDLPVTRILAAANQPVTCFC